MHLHARPADRASRPAHASRIRRSTRTPSRPAHSIRKLAALDPAVVWAGHAEPVTGDVAASSRAPRARRRLSRPWPDGTRKAHSARSSPPRPPSTATPRATCSTLRGSLTPGARAEYADVLARRPAARGRLAAGDRAAVRAPRRVVDDLGRADRAPEGAARPLPDGLRTTSGGSSATRCARTPPSTSRSSRRHDRSRRVRRRCSATGAWRCEPDQQVLVSSTTPRRAPLLALAPRAAAARSLAAGCASRSAGAGRGLLPPRRPRADRRASRRWSWLEAQRPTRASRIDAPANTRALAGDRSGAASARRARARAGPGGAAGATLVRHDLADAGARPAGGDERRRLRGVRRARAVPGPARTRSAAWRELSARQAALVERLHRAREIRIEADGHRPAPARRRPDLDQLRRPAQHAQRRGVHRARSRTRPTGTIRFDDPVEPARRARRGRRARPSSTGKVVSATAAARRRTTSTPRSRPTTAPASSASSGSAPTRASTAPTGSTLLDEKMAGHRPPRARALLSGDRRARTSRRCTGI